MAVTKIQRVNSITHTVNYITRSDKTEQELITSYNCSPETIKRNFENVLDEYNYMKGTDRELKARMIIQSYDPEENITPEQAHEYGKEFAENYLGGNFQYIIATHHDVDHIHNHIVFNDINFKTLEIFDSSRENTLHRMRNENDLVSEKYGLKIIEQTRQKHKYLTHKDYVARSKGISFKQQIENDIDDSIQKSNSFDDFLGDMERKGYEVKRGKHLAFKSPTGKKFMRTKTLGFNYVENSIKYRIENKDYIPFKPKVISREWIDKSQEKFKENKGLNRWATLQNINYLHEVNNVLSKENISLEQFVEEENLKEDFVENLEKRLSKIDNQIHKLENMADCYDVYKESHSMIIGLKKLETEEAKDEYKKENFQGFKKYDMAKKNMNILKKGYHIHNKEQLQEKLSSLNDERKLIYESVNLNKEQDKRIEKEQKQQRNSEMEL
jgi:hypothetical protein